MKPAASRVPSRGSTVGANPEAARPSWLRGGDDHHVLLDLSVVPGAKRTVLAGLHDGALRVQLNAPPVDGKANAALERFIAELLGRPARDVQVTRGLSSRRKTVKAMVGVEQAKKAVAAQLRAAQGDGE